MLTLKIRSADMTSYKIKLEYLAYIYLEILNESSNGKFPPDILNKFDSIFKQELSKLLTSLTKS